jgi:hypothetical protein
MQTIINLILGLFNAWLKSKEKTARDVGVSETTSHYNERSQEVEKARAAANAQPRDRQSVIDGLRDGTV